MKKITFLLAFFTVIQLHGQIPTEGLVAYYELDNNALESSGNMHHGNIVGTLYGALNRFEQPDKAALFDGSENYIELSDSTLLNITQEISISLWIKPIGVSFTGWIALVNKWEDVTGPGGKGYYLGINPDGLALRWNSGSVNSEGSPVLPAEWINIVATYDSDSLKIYRNIVLESAVPAVDTIQPTIVPFRIAWQSQFFEGNENYYGLMDEVLIYNRALSQSEISQIYNSTPTSTDDDQFENLIVYPNPFGDIITIKTFNPDIIHGEIIDMQGRIIKKILDIKGSQQISTIGLRKGFYILNLYTDKGLAISKKIIKS